MRNLKRAKIPILAFMTLTFIVGFAVLMFIIYDFLAILYTELLIVLDVFGQWFNEISKG